MKRCTPRLIISLVTCVLCIGAMSPRAGVIAGGRKANGGGSDYRTNLALELDGDSTYSGGTWTDTSGNGNHASQPTSGARPTLATNVANGHSGLTFDGTNDFLSGSVAVSGTNFAAFAVVKVQNAGHNYGRVVSLGLAGAFDYTSASYAAAILRDNGTQALTGYRNNASLSSKAITYDTVQVIESVFDGTNHTMLVNGVAASTTGSTGTFSISDYMLGNNVYGADSAWASMTLLHVRIYSTDPGSTNRSTIRQYLGSRYGVSVTP